MVSKSWKITLFGVSLFLRTMLNNKFKFQLNNFSFFPNRYTTLSTCGKILIFPHNLRCHWKYYMGMRVCFLLSSFCVFTLPTLYFAMLPIHYYALYFERLNQPFNFNQAKRELGGGFNLILTSICASQFFLLQKTISL